MAALFCFVFNDFYSLSALFVLFLSAFIFLCLVYSVALIYLSSGINNFP